MPPRHVPTGVRPGPKVRPPWETAVSLRAGLPADRGAWLSRVLPLLLDAARSMRAIDAELSLPLGTVTRWQTRLAEMRDAGELPELRRRHFPERDGGFGPNHKPPPPTTENARKAARARWDAQPNLGDAMREALKKIAKPRAKKKRAPKR